MPGFTTIMVLTNVGLQLFNNWRNTQTSDEMRRKQQEFQRAAQERNQERMMQLLREGQTMQEKWEAENHKNRVEDIEKDFKKLLERTFLQHALQSWPLRVLPMVMKNQSLGNLRKNNGENIALHVILTPSNSDNFNTTVFPKIELGLEAFFNRHWNTMSSHPVIFYGGAWKSNMAPEQTEIDLLKANLQHLPVLMITPYFTPDEGELVFNINMWGMGKQQTNRNDEQFDINSTEMVIQPSEQEFSYYNLYAPDTNYGDELAEVTIEEFVPYLQCMIGYLADVYFWSAHNRTPILPTLLSIGTLEISYKQQTNLIEGYANLFQSNLALLNETPTDSGKLTIISNYLLSTSNLMDKTLFQKQLENLYLEACNLRGYTTNNIQNAIVYAAKNNIFLPTDTDFLKQFAVFHKAETTIKKNKKHYNMKTLDAKTYSQKRDELLGLIRDVLEVDGIKDLEKSVFLTTQRRLQENQFNVVLIGEFQGGKSTTFNALCGGREISPRGAMNKTSAICITATNLSDKNEKEYAIVSWKSNADKLKLMDSFVGLLKAEDLGVIIEDESLDLEQHFSFENPQHLDALKKVIEMQEKIYKYEPDKNREYYEVLRIAKLIISFSTDEQLKQYLSNNKYDIVDIQKFAVFPEEWDERWSKIQDINDIKHYFTVEDALFVFVGEINCHIHSDNLAQLGCSITDCPGLFASSWDTSVALNALSQANAVIYLLGGGKQMGEGDEKAISEIFQHKSLADKVFFALNKKKNDTITATILSRDTAKLKNLGVNNATIWEFNALLFFLGEFGSMLLTGQMDSFSKKQFLTVANRNGYEGNTFEDIESIWCEIISDAGVNLKKSELKVIDNLEETACRTAKLISKSDELLSTLNNAIIAQKAESILVNNGADKVDETLNKIAARLKSTEDNALKTVQEAEAEFQSAQEAYSEFEQKVNRILSMAFPDYLSNQLAQNAYIEITKPQTIDNIALKLAVEIPKKLTAKTKANSVRYKLMQQASKWKIFKDKAIEQRDKAEKELKELLDPIVRDAVNAELSNAIEQWQNSLNNGEHIDYKAYILPKLDEVENKIKEEWDKIISGNELLKGYGIPKINLDKSLKGFDTFTIAHNKDVVDSTADAAIGDIVKSVITEVVSILSGIIVGVIMDLIFTGGLGLLLGAMYGLLAYIFTKKEMKGKEVDPVIKEELSKNQKKIYDNIRPSLGDTFQKDTTRQKAMEGLKDCPQNIFASFSNYYKKHLEQQENELKADIQAKRAAKQESLDKQQEVAEHARVVRKQQIEPLEKKISNFIDSCY